MSEQWRKQAFYVAAGLVVVGLALALLVREPPAAEPPKQGKPVIQVDDSQPQPTELRHGTEPNPRLGSSEQRRAARRVALRFLHAFLAYQDGRAVDATRRELNRTAEPILSRALLREPVRAPRRDIPSARIAGVRVYGIWHGRAKASVELHSRRAAKTLLEYDLVNSNGRWRVRSFYP